LLSEAIKITTNWICCSGPHGGGSV